ncbi:MAG: UDP-glucose/GDP-mannose dehydrogenase family protein [Deltaproteobacteria bacterium]|nr:UDP-glucose/GDP-mannose dehydrogenase family protein [Deltaproteobacteria bacterium]
MRICMIGTGYVGLVTGCGLAEFGMKVTCVDKITEKIEMLKRGDIPEAIRNNLVIFLAVGTPSDDDGGADLQYLFDAVDEIARNLNGYKVIAIKSTVPVGTAKRVTQRIAEQVEGAAFDVVSNPEFLREGSAVEDFLHPDRVVIGTESEQAVAIMKDIYSPLYLIETPFVITNNETAEMIKYASNTFLAAKISYINEVANICELVGADVHVVARAMGLDGRISRKFLHPGPGFGGSCFPKDTRALYHLAREKGYDPTLIGSVIRVNENQKTRMVDKVKRMVGGDLKGKVIGVLGVSFKPNTDDIRESPAIYVIKSLLESGAKVRAFDPAALGEAQKVFGDTVTYASNAYEVAEGADAVVLMTEWNQFRSLDLQELKGRMKTPIFVDTRNVYDPRKMAQAGFAYEGVGR